MAVKSLQSKLPRKGLAALLATLDIPGEIQLPDGSVVPVGTGLPKYRVIFRSENALSTPMTELSVGRAYVSGDIEVEGDFGALFGARQSLTDKVPLRQKLQFLYDYYIRSATAMNKKPSAITTVAVMICTLRSSISDSDSIHMAFLRIRMRASSRLRRINWTLYSKLSISNPV